jgi:hypothetical protein
VLKKLAETFRYHRQFERTLAFATPLILGGETRKVARALAFDNSRADEMLKAVPFEPRETYPARALEWANGA